MILCSYNAPIWPLPGYWHIPRQLHMPGMVSNDGILVPLAHNTVICHAV